MNDLNNKVVQTFPLPIETIFWQHFTVIAEYIKTDVAYIITLSVKNWFFTRKFSESKLMETGEWQFALVWNTYYWPRLKINHTISIKSLDVDVEEAIYLLTKDIQCHLFKNRIESIVDNFRENWLNINYNKVKNWSNVDFEIFNIDNPCRIVSLYIDEWDVKMDFIDTWMSQEQIEEQFLEIEEYDFKTVYKWLKSESLS